MTKADIVETERTILFSDVVASTQFLCRHGNRDWVRLLRRHQETLETIARSHAGEICSFAGDGFAVAFPDPSRGVECALRLRLAFSIQGAETRFGVECGTVARYGGGEYIGLPTHVAARLTSQCQPGQILMSDACYQAAKRRATLPHFELAHANIRGLDSPLAVRFSEGRPR